MSESEQIISRIAEETKLDPFSVEFAAHLDANDELSTFRSEFIFPKTTTGEDVIYLCGNSLGLQPRSLRASVNAELDKWEAEAVEGHHTDTAPGRWIDLEVPLNERMSAVVGALPSEVVMMNSLTANLHLMMTAFYKPTASRFKILIEKKAFPSDVHAVVSQLQLHGLNPVDALLEVCPRDGQTTIHPQDIQDLITLHADSIALVLFSGVQYYTGQLFDMRSIVQWARAAGAKVGFDLAHAVGNVPLALHDWDVDFACWCTYKYMNSGPGCMGGCFVHEKHGAGGAGEGEGDYPLPVPTRMAGWWGHRGEDRFIMAPKFIPEKGALGFRLSNPPVLTVACVRASLDIFARATMARLRAKSLVLTSYLEVLLDKELSKEVAIFTPREHACRGAQLSISFYDVDLEDVLNQLKEHGVMCDSRKPNVIRIAPAPLYNGFMDVQRFVQILKKIVSK